MSVPTEEAIMTLINPQPVFLTVSDRGTADVTVDIMVEKFCLMNKYRGVVPASAATTSPGCKTKVYTYLYMLFIWWKKFFKKREFSLALRLPGEIFCICFENNKVF